MGNFENTPENVIIQRDKLSIILSILLIIAAFTGVAIYADKPLTLIDENLTNSYHETFRHSTKLMLDTHKIQIVLEKFARDPDAGNFDQLKLTIDLLYLRINVINNAMKRGASEELNAFQKIYPVFK